MARKGPEPDEDRAYAVVAAIAAFTVGACRRPTVPDLEPILERLFPESSPYYDAKIRRMLDLAIREGRVEVIEESPRRHVLRLRLMEQ